MKKILALSLILIMTCMLFSACGNEYDFCSIENGNKELKIELDEYKDGYSWVYRIGNLDKLKLVSEKRTDKKYTARFHSIIKSGKGKKGGKANVAFTYVNDKDKTDIIKGYVVNVSLNPKGKMKLARVDEYKVNFETGKSKEDK